MYVYKMYVALQLGGLGSSYSTPGREEARGN